MKMLRWHYPAFIFFDRCEGDQCNVSGIYAMVSADSGLEVVLPDSRRTSDARSALLLHLPA